MTNNEKRPETGAKSAELHLLRPWLPLDKWTCNEAMWLLSGNEPDGSEYGYVIDYDGYTGEHFMEGLPCFLDGPGHDDHPHREQSIEDMLALIRVMRNIDRDECRSPAEWMAFAKRNGFEPHWLKWAQAEGLVGLDLSPIYSNSVNSANNGSTQLNTTASDDADATLQGKVMRAILELGHDPLKFPRGKRGVSGARADVLNKVGGDKRLNNKAFDRLIGKGDVVLTSK